VGQAASKYVSKHASKNITISLFIHPSRYRNVKKKKKTTTCVVGRQNGSVEMGAQWLKLSRGAVADPDVLASNSMLNPLDSTTGSSARTMNKSVPSTNSSLSTLPRRLDKTPYRLPSWDESH
jgi:hypothetical protein